jgi:hypothetical protein
MHIPFLLIIPLHLEQKARMCLQHSILQHVSIMCSKEIISKDLAELIVFFSIMKYISKRMLNCIVVMAVSSILTYKGNECYTIPSTAEPTS